MSFAIYKKKVVLNKRENQTRKLHILSLLVIVLLSYIHIQVCSFFFTFFFSMLPSTLVVGEKTKREGKSSGAAKWCTVSFVQLILIGNSRWEISIHKCERTRRSKVWNQSSSQYIVIECMTHSHRHFLLICNKCENIATTKQMMIVLMMMMMKVIVNIFIKKSIMMI